VITIQTPLCHGSTEVHGTAEPGQSVSLVITDTGYQDNAMVDGSGNFTFNLLTDQPLQTGQSVGVSGYGENASAVVEACTTDAYITISPQCGPSGSVVINVTGYNWQYQNNNDDIAIKWNGSDAGTFAADTQPSRWEKQITVTVTAGTHQVSAGNKKIPQVAATFVSPCPTPNLIVTDLHLLATEPISTYQPLDFGMTVANVGSRPVNTLFWVDLYSAEPTSQTSGITWAAVTGLNAGDSIPLTITLSSGFDTLGTYQVWALADSWSQVSETSEEDNADGPITVNVSEEGTPPSTPVTATLGGSIIGETWVSLTGIPVPHARADVRCIDGEGNEASTTSDDSALYEFDNLLAGTYTVIGETWINGVRYSNTYEVDVIDGETTVRFIIMYRN